MSDLDQKAADLVQEAQRDYEQAREEQQEVLSAVAEEEGAEVLETQCNIAGDHTVPLKAKLNGKVLDQMSRLDARVERFEDGEARMYEVSETADETSQLLGDVIDDPAWDKDTFYGFYEKEGIGGLGTMLSRVFDSLIKERERRQGAAEGFRPTQ